MYLPGCWLARHGEWFVGDVPQEMPSCEGILRRVHLIPQQYLRRTAAYRDGRLSLWDPAVWVWACGGLGFGAAGHHGAFDHPGVSALRVPRRAVPDLTERFAEAHDLVWALELRYGEQD